MLISTNDVACSNKITLYKPRRKLYKLRPNLYKLRRSL